MLRQNLSFRAALAGGSRPLVGAHRGASAVHAENTLAAFAAALVQGADFWELDVRLSADGIPVVIHDETIDRTTGGRGLVQGLPARTLEGYGVPTLANLLALGAGRTFFNIELKSDGDADALTETTMAAVSARGLTEQVLVSSFDHTLLPLVKTIAPTAMTGVLYETPLADPVGYAEELGADAVHPLFRLAGARLANSARDAGLAVIPWTVDRPIFLRYFAAIGVHGVITNKPAVAVGCLSR